MILTFNTLEELVNSFITKDGELNGYIPQHGLDATKLTYPVKIEVLDETGMFRLYEESKVEKIVEVKKKSKLSKKAIIGIIYGSVSLAIIIIVGIVCAVVFSGCSTKYKCVEYNENGNCIAEEIVYKVKGANK